MKFLVIIFLLIGSSAYAQKDVSKKSIIQDSVKQLMEEWDKFKGKMYRPGTNLPSFSDSLDMDISWDDIYKSGGFGPCYCPSPEQVQKMPRELHPYQWVNEDKPIIIDDSTMLRWIKSDLTFKKMYQRADSLKKVSKVIQ